MKIRNISIALILFLLTSLRMQAQMSPEMQKMMKEQNAKTFQQLEKNDPRIKDVIEKMKKDPSMKKQLELMGMDSSESEVSGLTSSSQTNGIDSKTKNGDANQTIQDYYPMPVQNLNHHAMGIPQLKTSDLSVLAQNIIKNTKFRSVLLKKKLDDMAKSLSLNISGTGTFYLFLGLPIDACGYLIAKGIIEHPTDPYAANGFGVYFRDKHELAQALQCFFYANKLLSAKLKSPYIYTNIGWASFYYGDFKTAGKYFDSALSVSNSFIPALEGQATLAFTKGDIKTLFACLAKELLAMTKTAGGGGGGISSGPSPGFASVCGGAFSPEDETNDGSNQGSSQSSPFDHIGDADNSPEQDAPPDADVTFPGLFKPDIINDLLDGASEALANINGAEAKANSVIEALKKRQQALSPRYAGRSYIKEDGSLAHDRDYSNLHNLHGLIILQFESRVDKDIKSFEKFASDYNTKTTNRISDLSDKWTQVRKECGDDSQCAKAKYCIITKQAHTEGNNFLEIGAEKWGKLYDKVVDDINWFLRNDAVFVSRVPDIQCNEDMNIDREIETATAILEAYDCLKDIYGPLVEFEWYAKLKVECPPVEMGGIAHVSLSKAPKHIKEYEDKKYKDKDITYSIGILGSITENSHSTTFTIGPKIGPVQLGFSYTTNKDLFTGKVKDQIYSENNDFDHSYSVSAGIAYKTLDAIEIDAGVGGSVTYDSKGNRTAATANAGGGGAVDFGEWGKIGAAASMTWQMDGNWNITGYSDNVTVAANLGGNVEVDKDPNKVSEGHALSGVISATSNYDAAGNYIGGNASLNASLQGSATTNSSEGNSEYSLQNNYFGIQVNQVIQVVAGQEVVSPPTVTSN